MFIESIEIINFQKHEHFIADFVNGVNSIIGETDQGKSCIVRAMRWVLFNEPKGDIVRKSGTDRTTVALTLDNGVKVVRLKGTNLNAYELYAPGVDKPTRFDSVGSDTPEEVKNALGVDFMHVDTQKVCLNIASQLDAPFLLSETAGFRMKVLNKLVGSDILDLVSQDLNKDILKLGREEKIINDTLDDIKKDLITIESDKVSKEERLAVIKDTHKMLTDLGQKYLSVSEDIEALKENVDKTAYIDGQIKDIVDPAELPQLKSDALKFNSVNAIKVRLVEVIESIVEAERQISGVQIPEGIDESVKLSSRYAEVKGIVDRAVAVTQEIGGVLPLIEASLSTTEQLRADYKALLKQYGKCPLCHSEATPELLESIEL